MKIVQTILIIALVIVACVLIVRVVNVITNDCLKEVAEDYCEDKGMLLNQIHIDKIFTCKENERAINFEAYKFLEDEIEECKN